MYGWLLTVWNDAVFIGSLLNDALSQLVAVSGYLLVAQTVVAL